MGIIRSITKLITGIMLIAALSAAAIAAPAYAGIDNSQLPEDISSEQTELIQIKLYSDIYFLNKKMEFKNKPLLATGRVYLPLVETVEQMGGTVKEDYYGCSIKLDTGNFFINKGDDIRNPKKLISLDGVTYISMFKLLAGSGYEPSFSTYANRIDILRSQRNIPYNNIPQSSSSSAYLRLEDIMADGVDPDGYYTNENLEKLRVLSDYLYKNKQKFYIAWIPLYKNPNNNIENNLITDINLYNADFLYTLDYLVYRGGKIGIHGYTHQYNNDKSAEGYEFGEDTPFSDIECINRMLEAKKVARDLGYDSYFFEFPHYASTADQERYAEKYFDVIYQQDSKVLTKGYIVTWNRANGREIKYVPTPADYVYTKWDKEGILNRMDNCIKTKQVVSLFYHPRIEFDNISLYTRGDIRIGKLSETSIIYSIVEKAASNGLVFGNF